ncbi:hypothetical protein Val02_02610 [Virgisporangium aliadipatigenens]|uniref:Uncharacterized protein n=1 Tax=Virgisporangium aliadipatigenens TaxID=741659 RepID=A0A8J4DM37_9ACTN|nr:hypothetical protein Val02_02610 [Virgisporangium aliadipatigenens]
MQGDGVGSECSGAQRSGQAGDVLGEALTRDHVSFATGPPPRHPDDAHRLAESLGGGVEMSTVVVYADSWNCPAFGAATVRQNWRGNRPQSYARPRYGLSRLLPPLPPTPGLDMAGMQPCLAQTAIDQTPDRAGALQLASRVWLVGSRRGLTPDPRGIPVGSPLANIAAAAKPFDGQHPMLRSSDAYKTAIGHFDGHLYEASRRAE